MVPHVHLVLYPPDKVMLQVVAHAPLDSGLDGESVESQKEHLPERAANNLSLQQQLTLLAVQAGRWLSCSTFTLQQTKEEGPHCKPYELCNTQNPLFACRFVPCYMHRAKRPVADVVGELILLEEALREAAESRAEHHLKHAPEM